MPAFPKNVTVKRKEGYKLTIKFTGFEKVYRNLGKLKKKGRVAAQKFLKAEAQRLVRASKERTPVDTERLRDSTRVLTFGTTGRNKLMVSVAVGGKVMRGRFVDYAAAVHKKHKSKSQFLKRALDALRPSMIKRFNQFVKAEMKKGN